MSLRERNGTDPEVRDYVFRGGTADVLMRYLTGMIDFCCRAISRKARRI